MKDRYIKYLVRKFTLLEHSLIMESLTPEHTCIPEIFFRKSVDIVENGLMDICISEDDFEENKRRVVECAGSDPDYIAEKLHDGLFQIENLLMLPADFPEQIPRLSTDEIVSRLEDLRGKMFAFGGYVEFTHSLGKADVTLSDEELRSLGAFHDKRRIAFVEYFKFVHHCSAAIASRIGLTSTSVSWLLFDEILDLLRGKLTPSNADALQEERRDRCIIQYDAGKETVFCGVAFEERLATLKFLEYFTQEIKGICIGRKGIVRGEVQKLTPDMDIAEISEGKILVTPMTTPFMIPILRKSKAIITDEGGLLCHAAVTAREFDLLTIIGTKIASKILHDGDLVEVDTHSGIVKVL